jgi:hypothetical protein
MHSDDLPGRPTADAGDRPFRVAKRLSERERHWQSLIGSKAEIRRVELLAAKQTFDVHSTLCIRGACNL